jgi:hypothetical protein
MQNREDKNSLFFENFFRSFLFKKQYEKVKNGNKKKDLEFILKNECLCQKKKF